MAKTLSTHAISIFNINSFVEVGKFGEWHPACKKIML